MIRKSLVLVVAMVVVFCAPVLAEKKLKDAFVGVNKKTLVKEYSQLAMAPISADSSLAVPDETLQLIENQLQKLFAKNKFQVLEPGVTQGIIEQFSALYSEQKIPEDMRHKQRSAINEHAYRELFYRHPVDGLITVNLKAMAAPFSSDKAQWDGTTQKIKHRGDGLLKIITGKNYGGHIAVSTIQVIISDRLGRPLYQWAGGVEVLMQRNGKQLEPLPSSAFWKDEKRILKAVKYALKPL